MTHFFTWNIDNRGHFVRMGACSTSKLQFYPNNCKSKIIMVFPSTILDRDFRLGFRRSEVFWRHIGLKVRRCSEIASPNKYNKVHYCFDSYWILPKNFTRESKNFLRRDLCLWCLIQKNCNVWLEIAFFFPLNLTSYKRIGFCFFLALHQTFRGKKITKSGRKKTYGAKQK